MSSEVRARERIPIRARCDRRLRVLVLSWNHPTAAAPLRGLWVERMCVAAAREADVRVIVPTPWVPPFISTESMARFRRIPQQEQRGCMWIYYPRVVGSIEYHTHGLDARLARVCSRSPASSMRNGLLISSTRIWLWPAKLDANKLGDIIEPTVRNDHFVSWCPFLRAQGVQRFNDIRALDCDCAADQNRKEDVPNVAVIAFR